MSSLVELSQFMGLLLVFAVMAAGYLIPTIIAAMRGHRNTVPIFVINLLLGWTGMPWAIALAWSLMDSTRRQQLDVRLTTIDTERSSPVVERWKTGAPW